MEHHNEVSAAEAAGAGCNMLIAIGSIVAILMAMSIAMQVTLTPLNDQFKAEQTATAAARP